MNNEMSAEERDILDRFERGELRSALDAEREVEIARQAARNTFNKTKRVNLRVTERDFNLAHSRAREEGIPYQTLLSSVIHKYLSGRLIGEEVARTASRRGGRTGGWCQGRLLGRQTHLTYNTDTHLFRRIGTDRRGNPRPDNYSQDNQNQDPGQGIQR